MINRKIVLAGFPIFILIGLCLTPLSLSASQVVIKSEDQFQFAYQYMAKGEHLKAVIEFERFIYLFPNDPLVIKANYFIGLCDLLDQKHQSARERLGKIVQENRGHPIALKSLFLIGESYYRQGISNEGERVFRMITEQYPQSPYQNLAYYRLGWVYLREGRWQEANDVFLKVDKQDPLFSSSLTLAQDSLLGENLNHKNPQTAGILAGILPGLGHVYCERPQNGVIAFLLNGIFTWAAIEAFNKDQKVAGSLLSLVEVGWYTGNIYSAVNCAHKYNKAQKNDLLKRLKDDLDLKLIFSKDIQVGLSLSFSF